MNPSHILSQIFRIKEQHGNKNGFWNKLSQMISGQSMQVWLTTDVYIIHRLKL